jgi:hypothetical protein
VIPLTCSLYGLKVLDFGITILRGAGALLG